MNIFILSLSAVNERYYNTLHPSAQLIFLALIALISFFVLSILSILLGIVIFKIPLQEWMDLLNLNDPSHIPVLKYLQITQSLSLFVIPPVIVAWLSSFTPWRHLGLMGKPSGALLGVVALLVIAMLPFLNLTAIWNEALTLPGFFQGIERWMESSEEKAALLTEQFLSVDTFGGFLVNLLMVAILPAFGEEFMFRGTLQPLFQRWFRSPHAAIIVTSILFSALHMQFYGFLPRFILGMAFGYLFYWSGNLWFPMLAHFINNFLPVTVIYFFHDSYSLSDIDRIGSGSQPWLWAIPSVLFTMALLLYFQRKHLQNTLPLQVDQP